MSCASAREARGRRGSASGRARSACGFALLVALLPGLAAPAELLLHQGTDFAVAAAGNGDLVMDLAGRLWRVPAGGGRAVAMTPAGVYVRRPAFSPDGKHIAWQALREGFFQVFVADADAGNARQITAGNANHLSPGWSPDGARVAYASDRGGDFSLWESELASDDVRQLTFEPGDELDPAWSPDGRLLAYVSERPGTSALLVRVPFQPSRVVVTDDELLRSPAWRPDGSVITYAVIGPQGPRLNMAIMSDPAVVKPVAPGEAAGTARAAWLDRGRFFYTADGHIRERGFGELTSTDVPFEAMLQVSPVGEPPARQLAGAGDTQAVHGLAGLAVLPNGHVIVSALGDLWELDANGGLVRALSQDAYVDRDPAVSADGRWLAFTSDRDGASQIWVRDLAGEDLHVLTTETGAAGRPAWNWRADAIAYLAADAPGGSLDLKVVEVGSRKAMRFASGLTQTGTPAWTPDDARIGLLQHEQGQVRLLLYPADRLGTARRVTLPAEVVGPGVNEAQWSPDGKALLIASAAGIRTLAILDNGLVGAEWRSVADAPAGLARWLPGAGVLFTDAAGLVRATGPSELTHIAVPLTWRTPTGPGRTIIRATRVFDGVQAEYLPNHEIVIEGDRIVALGPWFTTTPAPEDTVIDARGKTVMPGLVDLSVGLPQGAGERLGRTLLAYGVTTVQVLGGQSAEIREIAERWEAHAAGPRLLQAADWCGASAPAGTDATPPGTLRLCPAAIVSAPALVQEKRAAGATIWSPSWLAAASGVVDVVGPLGTLRAGPADEPLAGISGAQYLYQDAIDILVRSGAVLVPALAVQGLPILAGDQPDLLESAQYLALLRPEERRAQAEAWKNLADSSLRRRWLRDNQRLIGRISAGGGRLATASGAPAVPYGLGLQGEIRLLAGAGLPRYRALQMATSEAARAVGLQEQIGAIAPGRAADLLIVAGDPLADLKQLLAIETVIVGGRLRSMASLLDQPAGTAKKFTAVREAPPPKARRPRR